MLCIPEKNKQKEIPFQNSMFPRKKFKNTCYNTKYSITYEKGTNIYR